MNLIGVGFALLLAALALGGGIAVLVGLVAVVSRNSRWYGLLVLAGSLSGAIGGFIFAGLLALVIEHSLRYLDAESWALWAAAGAGSVGFPVALIGGIVRVARRRLGVRSPAAV